MTLIMAPRECKGPRLFVEGLSKRGAIEPNSLLSLSPQDSHYLKDVLRLPVGSLVEIGDPDSGDTFKASIASNDGVVTLSIVEKFDSSVSDLAITLLCALCKGPKNELICDWATELGCSQIVFWQSDRSIVRLKGDDDAKAKAEKFSKTALAAAQQSRQVRPPKIAVTTSLEKALEVAAPSANSLKVCCSLEHDAQALSEMKQQHAETSHVLIVVGPEGDITPEEHALLTTHGFQPASLGRTVLRSELAVVTAITTIKNS